MDLLGQFEHATNLGLFESCFLSGAGVALLAGTFAVQGIRHNVPVGIELSALSYVHLYTVHALLGIRAPRPEAVPRTDS
jgi:hypothetical protein